MLYHDGLVEPTSDGNWHRTINNRLDMELGNLELRQADTGLAIEFDGRTMVVELGVGIPIHRRWRWSFDGSLRLLASGEQRGRDSLGDYAALVLTYADRGGPLIQQTLKAYRNAGPAQRPAADTPLLLETMTLRDLEGIALGDSFFNTTFNSPIVRLGDGLSYLTYTWGLQGGEGAGIGGYWPDVVIASDIQGLQEKLRLANSATTGRRRSNSRIAPKSMKSFAPLIAYDDEERTLILAPLDHFLISPMRLINTPSGVGVARGLHGAVGSLPSGTTTRTALVFGRGVVETTLKWGDLLLQFSGKTRGKRDNSPLRTTLGFWNCYGGYYAELFRLMDADTLRQLSAYFKEEDIPVRYIGLDLWYHFQRVGFARSYQPDPAKYPEGLKALCQETGLPFLLHMSAFDADNDYLGSYNFTVDETSSCPAEPRFYQDLAREFRAWKAIGIWTDFLRTQLQHSRSLRNCLGAADQWFDGLARSMAEQGLCVMLCMPTVGHYLASAAHDNVVAVRTSPDYLDHQRTQVEMLGHSFLSPQRNLRQNLFLSLLAGAVGLAPSYDVFITNQKHPEGFADPYATREALIRALSAGIVGVGDKLGCIDKEIVGRLAFPDGSLSQPDHPPYPVAATIQSDVPAFYTSTSIGAFRWTYLALFNLAEVEQEYCLDLAPLLSRPLGETEGGCLYDYFAARPLEGHRLEGRAAPGEGRYCVILPEVGGLYLLGFPEKYVTLSTRQVKGIEADLDSVTLQLQLPAGREYTFAVVKAYGRTPQLGASGRGLQIVNLRSRGELVYIQFRVDSPSCSLVLCS